MIAIAMERARAVEQLGQTEAAREGERLRTALLDSVTHNLRTPLTSIKASVTSLLSNQGLNELQSKEFLVIINEETDRLNRMVGEASEMAQLDAGEVKLRLASHPIQDVIAAALQECKAILGAREVHVERGRESAARQCRFAARKGSSHTLARKCAPIFAAGQPITITAEAANYGVSPAWPTGQWH